MTAVENLLTEIDEKDKGSFSFRYPYKSANKKDISIQFSLPQVTIDLKNLKKVFEKLTYYFDSINEHALIILYDRER